MNQGPINQIPPVVDNLTSTSTTSSLSANQGKVLNEKTAIVSGTNYCKLPDGTMMCWGNIAFNAQAVGKQKVTVIYPASFKETPCTTISWNDSENVSGFFGYIWVVNPNATQFIACSNRTNATYDWYARWIAIGKWK